MGFRCSGKLQLIFGDLNRILFTPPLLSEKITITGK